jgi:methionine synthase II (cobalamin-independent)
MAPPFRADHVGSLIRPQALLAARAGKWGKKDEQVTEETQKAIAWVVEEQTKRGIRHITSGEYERDIFFGGFFSNLPGFRMEVKDASQWRSGLPTMRQSVKEEFSTYPVPIATTKVTYDRSVYLDDWLQLRSMLPEQRWHEAKMTLPSPCTHHLQLNDGEAYHKGVYDSEQTFLADVSAALRNEILILYDHGLRMVQIDDPNLTFFCDEEWIKIQQAEGHDLERLFDMYIQAHNDVLVDLPKDLTVGVHLCRGNFPQGVHVATGSYSRIASKLLRNLNYHQFYLEFDSPRAGDFQPLESLPVNKAVVLGIVTTKFAELEDESQLKDRVYQAADAIAKGQNRSREDVLRDNLAVSPQCGFASVAHGSGVGFTIDTMWKKLELVKKIADNIWS